MYRNPHTCRNYQCGTGEPVHCPIANILSASSVYELANSVVIIPLSSSKVAYQCVDIVAQIGPAALKGWEGGHSGWKERNRERTIKHKGAQVVGK